VKAALTFVTAGAAFLFLGVPGPLSFLLAVAVAWLFAVRQVSTGRVL